MTKPPTLIACADCLFWNRVNSAGECHRRAPTAFPVMNISSHPHAPEHTWDEWGMWPITTPESWCGEGTERPRT